MRALAAALALAAGCGDNAPGTPLDAALVPDDAGGDASVSGMLFGEPCIEPPGPQVGVCHDAQGACVDAACRPFCAIGGEPQCEARGGSPLITDRGACVCVP